MPIIMNIPEKGFYYHFKHDPSIGINHHAYEVIGLGQSTEDNSKYVIYLPICEDTYIDKGNFAMRPLEMFMETITRDGKTMQRFTKISDQGTISKLVEIRDKMYS